MLAQTFGILVGVLTIAAGLVWWERRLLGFFQNRLGPNRVGPFGVFQVLADTIKLLMKEDWIPPFADRVVFVLAPAIILVSVLLSFAVIPVAPSIHVVDLNIALLFFLAMSSMGAYSVVLAGWASDSKYALLGGLRGAAQMVSYEVFMGLSVMGVVMQAGSFSLVEIVEAQRRIWFFIPQFLGLIVFFIAGLAETHRIPFDLPEAESELVAGYHTEYSGMKFGLFFVGEYLGITLISALTVTLFFGGWLIPSWLGGLLGGGGWIEDSTGGTVFSVLVFLFKMFIILCLFILIRATLPRLRYDQLMGLGWKTLLPLSLLNILVTGAVLLAQQTGVS